MTFLHGHGVAIGSETSGSVRNVTIRDSVCSGTDKAVREMEGETEGIRESLSNHSLSPSLLLFFSPSTPHPQVRIKSQRGRGGVVENILYSNLTITEVSEVVSITMVGPDITTYTTSITFSFSSYRVHPPPRYPFSGVLGQHPSNQRHGNTRLSQHHGAQC